MLVSRNALQSYPTLSGENNDNYFSTRAQRDAYFANITANIPEYVAIAANGEDPSTTSWDAEVWQVEYFNGINWIAVNLSKNFALIVTNDGIKALTNASLGQYRLEISRVIIKQTPLLPGEDVSNWTLTSFINSNSYSDICLDSNNQSNTTFTLHNALTYKTNLLNGGLQFTLSLDTKCMGQKSSVISNSIPPTELDYSVSVIGLCVKDQREGNSGNDVLFALANLPSPIEKVVTTPDQVGNTLKFYLNTTLSNFGNVVNVQTIKSSVSSVPEVTSSDELDSSFNSTINIPYNLYVVDNYNGTNVPAIAIRKGNPISVDSPVVWSYITASDDTIAIDPTKIVTTPQTDKVKNYMIVAWNSNIQKYQKADSKDTYPLTGLYANNQIIYAGKIYNPGENFRYTFTYNTASAIDYHVGDILKISQNGVTFIFTVTTVDDTTGKPLTFSAFPQSGSIAVNGNSYNPVYDESSMHNDGRNLTIGIHSTSSSSEDLMWNFPSSWTNKPLYVDYNHSSESTTVWNNYCNRIGISTSSDRDRRGYVTIDENEYTISHFVGWCIDSNTVKLALDLRNEATYTKYGTTRYATTDEVKSVDTNAASTTSVTPQGLYDNYLKKEPYQLDSSSSTIIGDRANNPQVINTYTQFTKPIVSTVSGVAFQGTAFRAQWADLAEYYKSDKIYPAGTLITMGAGLAEITEAKVECNGIISHKPGYQLGEKIDDKDLPVALVGLVPVLFDQKCVPHFGDKIYLSKKIPGKASTEPYGKCLGKIIDKRQNLDQLNMLMCSVRIEF